MRVTPDGRYFVVRGRLWRMTNPELPEASRNELVRELMTGRRKVREAHSKQDVGLEKAARAQIHRAKVALGERGPPWWRDGAPDYNRHMAKNTPYAAWYGRLA